MSINQIDLGHQATIVVQNPITGANLAIPNLTMFDWKQITIKEESAPLNAKPIKFHTPNGWSGTFEFDRVDNTFDNFVNLMEKNYWLNTLTYSGTITVYFTELNGTTSQYLLSGVTMTLTDGGKFSSQKKVTCRVDWESADRQTIN